MEQIILQETLDFIQVDYAADNRTAEERLLPLAQDLGVGVLVNLPFGRGRLFSRVGDRELPEWAAEFGCESWGQFFLKYVVSHPAVTAVIPGTTSERHAVDNIGAGKGLLPTSQIRSRMEEFIDALPLVERPSRS
jgi:aryl-alcohol dehydrogenase-like predicted oxidoreductase